MDLHLQSNEKPKDHPRLRWIKMGDACRCNRGKLFAIVHFSVYARAWSGTVYNPITMAQTRRIFSILATDEELVKKHCEEYLISNDILTT